MSFLPGRTAPASDPLTRATQSQYLVANQATYADVLRRLQTLSSNSSSAPVQEVDPLTAWARRITDALATEGTRSPTYVAPDVSDTATAAAAVDAAAGKPPDKKSKLIVIGLIVLAWWLLRK